MATSRPSVDGHIVLVGLMGTGKTTVGRLLAARLGRPFVDSDAQVEARTGATVRQIFESSGEPAFRRHEAEALAEALAAPQPAVVAAAGGVVLSRGNRRLLRRQGCVVWLRADAATLAARVGGGDHRPFLGAEPAAVLERMARERAALYEDVADITVDVASRTPSQVADEIERHL